MEVTEQKGFKLNSLQEEAMTELNKALLERNKGLIVMPTGTGKTFLAAQWFREIIQKNPKARLLFICHQNDILTQANDKEFENRLIEFGIQRGYYNAVEKTLGQVTFATVQTLARSIGKIPKDCFDYIIVDEAHHYLARTFNKVVKYFTPKFLLGLTATPSKKTKNKGKEISILEVFDKIIYKATTKDAIEKGILSPIEYWCVDNDIDFSKTKWSGQYKEKDLNKTMCVTQYDEAIIKEYQQTAKKEHGRTKTICFCASVKHAYRMEKLFNQQGIKAVTLAGKYYANKRSTTLKSKRQQIISDFKNGVYDIIFVRDLFNEGMDVPDADCVMLFRPTNSSIIYIQQIGRGLRQFNGKKYLLVLDFIGNANRCDILLEELCNMVGFNLNEHLTNKLDDKPELIELNNGCKIRLSKRKYDVLRDADERHITKEKLIENYFNVKKMLKKQPRSIDVRKYGLYHVGIYRKFYGSWDEFLKKIGEPVLFKREKCDKPYDLTEATEQQLIDNYYRVKKLLGRQPMQKDLTKKAGSVSLYEIKKYTKIFGSWNKFLLKIGEQTIRAAITSIELINNYYDVKNELNRVPYVKEMDIYGKYCGETYRHRFGGWGNFLSKIGEPIKFDFRQSKEEELIDNYYEVKKKLGRQPYSYDINKGKYSFSKFELKKYYKHFGSWENFLIKIGQPLTQYSSRENTTNQELIDNYWSFKKSHGHVTSDMISVRNGSLFGIDTYVNRFGSWTKFLEKIGEKQRCLNISRESLIKNYLVVKKKLGRVPSMNDMFVKKGVTKYCVGAYQRIWGTWNNFLKEMGDLQILISKEKLTSDYFELKKKLGRQPKVTELKEHGKHCERTYAKHFGSWSKFLHSIGEPTISDRLNYSKEDLIINYFYVKKKLGRQPKADEFKNKSFSHIGLCKYRNVFGSWKNFLKELNEPILTNNNSSKAENNNLTLTPNYTPKNPLPASNFQTSGKSKHKINAKSLEGFKYAGSDSKSDIRQKIIEKIQDGDTVLMLESPELSALKEIEKQGKKPRKIVIPNHIEFDALATALKGYKTDLKIEAVNTSALQYLVDHEEENFNFLWLDYCGAFSYYKRDLDILFQRKTSDMKLILTYNIFDPKKQDDSYYFTNVISYVHKKVFGKSAILLMADVSQRYKKNLFSVGFDIKKCGAVSDFQQKAIFENGFDGAKTVPEPLNGVAPTAPSICGAKLV